MKCVRLVASVALAALLLVPDLHAGGETDADPLRVLFVGNSLTTTNDLPATVAGLAAAGAREIEVGRVTFDGFNEDHWNHGAVQAALSAGDWDVAIMQQGPSALVESQAELRLWATRLADEARAAGTRPGLLTVSPESYRQSVLTDVMASYRGAAQAAGADLYPAGEAWYAAWQCNPKLALYGPRRLPPEPGRDLRGGARRVRAAVQSSAAHTRPPAELDDRSRRPPDAGVGRTGAGAASACRTPLRALSDLSLEGGASVPFAPRRPRGDSQASLRRPDGDRRAPP